MGMLFDFDVLSWVGRQSFFVLTENHLLLLKNTSVSWNYGEFDGCGAPTIHPESPYVSFCDEYPYSDHGWMQDMALITGEPVRDPGNPRVVAHYERLHQSMRYVLEICLSTLQFRTGLYQRSEQSAWEWVCSVEEAEAFMSSTKLQDKRLYQLKTATEGMGLSKEGLRQLFDDFLVKEFPDQE